MSLNSFLRRNDFVAEDAMFEFSSLTIGLLVGAAFVGMIVVMISVASSKDRGHHTPR